MAERSTDEEGRILAVSRVGGALVCVGDRYLVGWFSESDVVPKRGQVVVGPLAGVGPRVVTLGPDSREVTFVIDENDVKKAEAEQVNWL